MRIRPHLPRGVRLLQWTLALAVVPPLAALWSRPDTIAPRLDAGSGEAKPPAHPYLRVVGVVPLRFKIELPPAPAIQRAPAAGKQPSGPASLPPPTEPVAPPAAAVPAPSSIAPEGPRKAPDQSAPGPRAAEPLLLDENQAKTPDEEIMRYFRFPGVDGGPFPPPPPVPPSTATYRQQ